MDRYRLIASIVVLFIYLLAMFPIQTIITGLVIGIAYLILRNINSKNTESTSAAQWRRNALKEASIYLAPYNDIWRNLKLSNKYCSLRLGPDGSSIIARDAVNTSRSFKVTQSRVHSEADLWNMFCLSFSHNTTFDGLVELCRRFSADIEISCEQTVNTAVPKENKSEAVVKNVVPETIKTDLPKEKLDVNNASEVELTALPGVSIVMAKKLIKRREEIGGFKSVDEVCLFLHLKPHMQNQLKLFICVNKMKGKYSIKRFDERNIDL